ncbi:MULTISPECIES: CidA/LrgA family protein [Priestia]|uniref:CidA/LrgA family protein n=1 Tax=Priestia TaxID=2800373 RepID=UPI000532B269|nr:MULTISPECIES: CidA/LrgA family holin-like protein [Priestia]MDT0147472.1 CidA/LrgA family holin-like protein [Priestia aryabhattai]MDT0152197.1 CidA/LrgA family holin-like protein [Priestia aryabhattai]MED3918812.1 CidA/LrgA family holin-like protein [Priestia aryabhattai]MED3947052.1 CidA/LrgA family holin-like protein [Priestia aryabhattai]MED3998495.1 CidA/LrgA family holin-like protein [Priestia aryabhattai]
MRLIIKFFQICFLYVFLMIGNFLSTYLHLPGSVLGLLLLFLLLQVKIVKVEWVELGAALLLAQLLLFFIPSSVGIMQYKQFIGFQGAKIILVIILSTAVVMASTGLSSKFLSKLRKDVKHESTSTDR